MGQFQAIGEGDEEAFGQAHRAAERAETERQIVFDDERNLGVARQRTHSAVSDCDQARTAL